MKNRFAVTCLVVLLGVSPAFALKVGMKVTPEWTKESGITVQTEKREDGTIGFTVTRYLDKAPQFPADSEFTTDRTAYLKINNGGGVMAETMVASSVKKDTEVYWLSLSRAAIAQATFSLWEVQDYKDPEKKKTLIGAGTIYDFDLAAFAAPLLKHAPLLHP